MGSQIEVTVNRAGVREYLNSASVQEELKRRAERITQKAGPGYGVHMHHTDRARAAIQTDTFEARASESKHGNLRRAIGGE